LFRVHCAVLKVRAGRRPWVAAHPHEWIVRRGLAPLKVAQSEPLPQDPTACLGLRRDRCTVPAASSCTRCPARDGGQLVNVPPLSSIRGANALGMGLGTRSRGPRASAP